MTGLALLSSARARRAIRHFEQHGLEWAAAPVGRPMSMFGRSVRCGCGWQSRGYKRTETALKKYYEHLLEAASS